MPLSMSNYDAALKDFYDGALRETLNSEIPAFATLEKSSRAWSGRRVVFPFRTARNSGVGFRAENGTLPTASNQTTSLAVTSATYAYGRIQLSGPIGIVGLLSQGIGMGIGYFLQMIGMLSINVAIINLLPIPAFDGGKLMFLFIEGVRKKPVPQKIEERITAVFFISLIILMVFVTIKDIRNFKQIF